MVDASGAMTVDLHGTTSVVIGGNQGIGEAIAVALASSGSRVVLAARDEDRLATAASRVEQAGGHPATTRRLDLADTDEVAAFAAEVVASHGAPTVLVNSAGGALHKPAFEVTVADWDQLHDTHVRGTFFACQAFGRPMADRGYGKIVNLSSTWATTTAPGRSVYCTAKAGVGHLTAALAIEWAPHGIRVNAIAPTSTRTPRVVDRLEREPGAADWATQRIPLGRLAETDDVTGAALYLASSASDFVTGHTIAVDGGWIPAK